MTERNCCFALLMTVFSACTAVSVPAPKAAPTVAVAAPAPSDAKRDAEEYRKVLEEAYQHILARSTSSRIPVADAGSALSMNIPDHSSIHGAVNYFSTDLHDSIQRSLLRSARFKPMIDKILDEYKLPRGLAYLPVIESAYVPNLTSSAGAHGIWQFMPGTGREYGLHQDWWRDDRADSEKATRAAAKYLRDLYNMFGDWSLALAAYNCGQGRVSKALAATGTSTYWELLELSALPKETRGYVPTFFATLLIVNDPATYGFRLSKPSTPDVKTVKVEGPVSLSFLAKAAGLDRDTIKNLNPQFHRGILPPGESTIKVPPSAVEFLSKRGKDIRFEDTEVRVATYELRSGDTLAKLAKLLKTTPADIRAMNGMGKRSPRKGESILLPVRQTRLSALLREQKAPAGRYYTVRKGDTLYSIARSHGLSVEELRELNRLKTKRSLRPGEKLKIALGSSVTGGM